MSKRKLVLEEDDCAPDALVYFIIEMREKFNLDFSYFKSNAKKVRINELLVEWRLGRYILSYSGDDPYHKLEVVIDNEKK